MNRLPIGTPFIAVDEYDLLPLARNPVRLLVQDYEPGGRWWRSRVRTSEGWRTMMQRIPPPTKG